MDEIDIVLKCIDWVGLDRIGLDWTGADLARWMDWSERGMEERMGRTAASSVSWVDRLRDIGTALVLLPLDWWSCVILYYLS